MRFVGTALVAGTIGVVFLLAQGGWIRAGTERSAELEMGAPRKNRGVAFHYSHFRDIAGMEVENVDGEKLGTIGDLVLDLESAQPEYVIVKSGGLIGGRRYMIVPISAIAMKTAKVGIAAIDITRRRWMHAPEFSTTDLKLLGQAVRGREIAHYYGPKEGSRVDKQEMEQQRLKPTGRETNDSAEPGLYRLARDLMKNKLIARQNAEVGEIADILIDLANTTPAYAIASGAEARFAVPLSLLRPLPGQRVAISADRRDFDKAKVCRASDLQNLVELGRSEIYRCER